MVSTRGSRYGWHGSLRWQVPRPCLLYTSDAADDMQCVDLGGRRIIKKSGIKISCGYAHLNIMSVSYTHLTLPTICSV